MNVTYLVIGFLSGSLFTILISWLAVEWYKMEVRRS